MLIALVAVVGFAGVWMTVLRPRAQSGEGASAAPAATGAASPGPTAPGMKGLGRAVQAAHGAVAASDASAARTEQAASGQTGKAADTGQAAPAQQTAPAASAEQTTVATPAAPVRAAPAARATVLLISGGGADDVAARAVVRSIHRPGVRTIIASIEDLGRYEALIGDVRIEALPTILVIGADHKAQRIVGLPDRAQVEQALDARL